MNATAMRATIGETATPAAPIKRKQFEERRLRGMNFVAGEPMALTIPDGLSLREVREYAVEYLAACGHKLVPGNFVYVNNDSNTLFGWWLCRMVIGSRGLGTKHVEFFPLLETTIGEAVDRTNPTDGYYVNYSNLDGWMVVNGKNGIAKFTGLSSRGEAENLATRENMNRVV